MEFSQENIGVELFDLGCGNGFLDMTPKTWVTKDKTDKLDLKFNQCLKLLYVKGYSRGWKDHTQNGKKIFKSYTW